MNAYFRCELRLITLHLLQTHARPCSHTKLLQNGLSVTAVTASVWLTKSASSQPVFMLKSTRPLCRPAIPDRKDQLFAFPFPSQMRYQSCSAERKSDGPAK
jgi:hypothetical protein